MIEMKINTGVSGHFTMMTTNTKTGEQKVVASFPNLILDAGLERMGTGSYLDVCRVGSGMSLPTVLQTQLDAKIASTNTKQTVLSGAQATPPYYGWKRITFRFAAGTATGNLSEVGVGWGNITTDNFLFSRALILDGGGSPTTISVLADEALDVIYELRLYPPLTDVVVSGLDLGMSTHTATVRAASVTDGGFWGDGLGYEVVFAQSLWTALYNGTIGAITTTPSGSGASADPTNLSYVPLSRTKKSNLNLSLTQANLAGGIVSLLTRTTIGRYQIGFSPAIDKTASRTLRLDLQVSWGRYVA